MAREGMRSTVVGIGINLLLATIKGTAGVVGHSYALIADAIESALDVTSSAVVWMGLRVSSRPPDDNHPYGHGKAEPLAALAVAGLVAAEPSKWRTRVIRLAVGTGAALVTALFVGQVPLWQQMMAS